ncbi:HtaA domain-containing protein [Corynebacterium sp. Marseille-P3884]|uniref:HtaA domain-containing protein n=1 Tax=Corynebacterium sp. Marseille-P3884 TaxID=2495409 RepID=UPI001FF0C9AF|nr:HtaA domain-containing protein [Corynebacterium sp. Marseille-P3884]
MIPTHHRISYALAATVLIGTTVAPFSQAEEAPRPTGTVSWPIKATFLNYVQGPIARGVITADNGAKKKTNSSGSTIGFDLPVNPAGITLDEQGNGTIELDGALTFLGHKDHYKEGEWGLNLTYSDMKVEIVDTTAKFVADYVVVGGLPESDPDQRSEADDAVIATYTLPQKITPGKNYKATTSRGELADGGVASLLAYELGKEIEPIALDLKYSDSGDPAPAQDSSADTEKSSKPSIDWKNLSSTDDDSLLAKLTNGVAVLLGIAGIVMAVGALIQGFADIFNIHPPEIKLPPLPKF